AGATIRGASRSLPSAAPAPSTPAASPSCSTFRPWSCRRGRACSRRGDSSTPTSARRSCGRCARRRVTQPPPTWPASRRRGAGCVEGGGGELTAEGRDWLGGEEVSRERQRFERSADLRYEHQSFELTCPAGSDALTPAGLGALIRTFHDEHRRLYTYDLPNARVELVNLRVTAVGLLPKRDARAAHLFAPRGRGATTPPQARAGAPAARRAPPPPAP